MIEAFYFTNLRNQTWQMNTDDCPLHRFSAPGNTRLTDRQKMQEAGDWPSFGYLDHQIITAEFDLLRDTVEDYVSARSSMLKIICPPPGGQLNRRWGTLFLKYFGQETVKSDCTVESWEDTTDAEHSNTVGTFMFNFKVFNPYWTGVASGTYYIV